MKRRKRIAPVLLFLVILPSYFLRAQVTTLDDFRTKEGWTFNKADGVELSLTCEPGITGNAIRFDYNFLKGTGYGGIQKFFPVDLPDNYEFSFFMKAESPANNFEIKFIDSSGNNVWWVNNRNYDFPEEWKKIRIRKRHIGFAWGPAADQKLKRVDRIEFTIASYVGGKGTIWIDDLKFEPLPPEIQSYPLPALKASSSLKDHPEKYMTDSKDKSYWQSNGEQNQTIVVDFTVRREFGGLHINWMKDLAAAGFIVSLSGDGILWEKTYEVPVNHGNSSFIRMPEAEARYLRLELFGNEPGRGYGIREISFPGIRETLTLNDFLIFTAKNSPLGFYPRYFREQAAYWTITGVNNDVKEALINEDGMVEAEKGRFSIEPVLRVGDSVITWNKALTLQSLGESGNLKIPGFVPTVTWLMDDLTLETGVTAGGEANVNSFLTIRYTLRNGSSAPKEIDMYLLIRPFQVNPYYQFLNITGGAGRIGTIKEVEPGRLLVDDKPVILAEAYKAFGAMTFDEGNPVDFIHQQQMPTLKSVTDPVGLASGMLKYTISLKPGEGKNFHVLVPLHGSFNPSGFPTGKLAEQAFAGSADFWQSKVSHIRFNLPPSADPIIRTYQSNLAYILINRDKAGIQPGSRSYERSWIRDGALTSSALLKSGIVEEVRDFINWYAAHQYESGKIPCVVDLRGPDPVPENDSHGEFIYLLREYFNFTNDTAFLRSKNPNVLKAVAYIEALIAQRSTDHFRNGNDSIRAYFGLVTESISHEGYSAKPMHSYWDDFFTMKGLKDAADIQKILGEQESYKRLSEIRDTFKQNLYTSLQLAMKTRKIDYVPGCVELGDFDATSTTIALTPCNELNNLPKPQVYNTFDKYYDFFCKRRDGKIDWINYTPYENRLIGSFILLDQPDRAHELIRFFLNDQRPQGWHHWAEVVWKDYRYPGYIGDMPHTWVGSDFINAIRSMFVYENEYDQSLVIAAALYQDWIDAPDGMSVNDLPTYYGEISYTIKKSGNSYRFTISGDLDLPVNGIRIRNFNGSKKPARVLVNGLETSAFTETEIFIPVCPADVTIIY